MYHVLNRKFYVLERGKIIRKMDAHLKSALLITVIFFYLIPLLIVLIVLKWYDENFMFLIWALIFVPTLILLIGGASQLVKRDHKSEIVIILNTVITGMFVCIGMTLLSLLIIAYGLFVALDTLYLSKGNFNFLVTTSFVLTLIFYWLYQHYKLPEFAERLEIKFTDWVTGKIIPLLPKKFTEWFTEKFVPWLAKKFVALFPKKFTAWLTKKIVDDNPNLKIEKENEKVAKEKVSKFIDLLTILVTIFLLSNSTFTTLTPNVVNLKASPFDSLEFTVLIYVIPVYVQSAYYRLTI